MSTYESPALWKIFAAQVISVAPWAPFAALMGMGYTPDLSWSNVLIFIFHLYSALIFAAIIFAYIAKNAERYDLSVKIS